MGVMEIPPKREQKNDFIDVLFSILTIVFIVLGVLKAVEIVYFVSEYVTISVEVKE